MRKKRAPEQYAAKPKGVVVKSGTMPPMHPALDAAKTLVSWMARGGVPPSIILLHGLHFARSPEDDGLPVDTYRPQLKMQGIDNKAISAILDALARPQADKTQVLAQWLQSVWVKKSPVKSRVPSSKNEQSKSTLSRSPVSPATRAKRTPSPKPITKAKKKG
ncbi:MAG: hypothetical protein WBM09_04425 [Gallionella sp.]